MPSERTVPFEGHEEGVPIKVIHERSDLQSNAEPNDNRSDSMSSFGSSHSQKSADTSHSSGSAFSGNASNRSNHSSDSRSSQPRVHHIPIQVEPRDGSSSSGYTSEANVAAEQPLSRSSSHSSANSTGNTVRNRSRTESPVSTTCTQEANNEEMARVRKIPIQVESKEMRRTASPSNESTAKAKNTPTPPKTKAKSGPFVTRIPVVNQTNGEEQKLEPKVTSDKEEKTAKQTDPMQEINKILFDLRNYETEVKQFDGTVDDKKYKYLDEMLTRCMIKLDTIETHGNEEVRKARKAAVLAVNHCIGLLEQKVFDNKEEKTREQSGQSEQPMQVSTPEPTSKPNINQTMITDQNEPQNTIQQNESKSQVNEQTSDQPSQSQSNHPKETAV